MGDDSRRDRQGIPSWQQATSAESDTSSVSPVPAADEQSGNRSTSDHQTKESPAPLQPQDNILIQQAFSFLRDEGVLDAPHEKKVAFLELKGLSKSQIETALSVAKDESGNTTLLDTESNAPDSSSTPSDLVQLFKDEQQPPPVPRRDIPPIITYPEFLVQPQTPAPLITVQRLITTAYVAGGVGAAIYGASRFLITPMVEALIAARHEFAENTQNCLAEFNQKLSSVVTVDPKDNLSFRQTLKEADVASEADTSDSDPTELFHRDYGTQTSPQLIASPTQSPSPDDMETLNSGLTSGASKVVDVELSLLQSMKSSCITINDRSNTEKSGTEDILGSIRSLNNYLDTLINPSFSYPNGSYYGGLGGGSNSKGDGSKKDDDEVTRLRSEIRGIKGVLLSAKNFPSGGRKTMFPSTSNVAG